MYNPLSHVRDDPMLGFSVLIVRCRASKGLPHIARYVITVQGYGTKQEASVLQQGAASTAFREIKVAQAHERVETYSRKIGSFKALRNFAGT